MLKCHMFLLLLLGFLPKEGLVASPLSSDRVGPTKLILFQMEGFTGVKIVGGQLRRWDDGSVLEFHLLTAVLRRVLLKMCF